MQTAVALARLDEHQNRILSHAAASKLLTREGTDAIPRLAKARWEVLRLLRSYQLFKHTEIFDPAIRRGNPRQQIEANRLKQQCLSASEALSGYVRHWSSVDVGTQWQTYVPAMHEMADHLRSHLLKERSEIRSLLAGCDRTRRMAEGGGRGRSIGTLENKPGTP